jgi:hypothetical protein
MEGLGIEGPLLQKPLVVTGSFCLSATGKLPVTGMQLLVMGKLPYMYSSDRRNKTCTSLAMIKGPKTYSFVVTDPLSFPSLAFISVIKK